MIGTLAKLGAWGAAGLLAGLALATWIGGLRPEGVALIVVVCIAAALVLGGLVRYLRRPRG